MKSRLGFVVAATVMANMVVQRPLAFPSKSRDRSAVARKLDNLKSGKARL